MRIPREKIWRQDNRGDTLGDLYASYNINLHDNLGALKVSPRGILAESSATLTNMGVPCAFRAYIANADDDVTSKTRLIFAIAGARVFHSDGLCNGVWKQDATSGTPTSLNSDQSDIELFNGYLYFSGASTSLWKFNGTWATLTSKVNNSSGLHQFAFLRSTNMLYFVDDNARSIGSINTSDEKSTMGGANTLQNLTEGSGVNNGSEISWIKASENLLYIGTINKTGTQSKVYVWDGITQTQFNETAILQSPGSLSCVIYNNVPTIIDVKGRLMQLNGADFVEIARLPFENDVPTSYSTTATGRFVHYNGMSIVDGKINILVNGTLWNADGTLRENIPSGVWEYTPETGLYHKASLGLSKAGATITDFGQMKVSKIGALQEFFVFPAGISGLDAGDENGRYLAGAQVYTNATSTANGIWYTDTDDTELKACSFVTSWILASEAEDVWQKVYARFANLAGANDKMVVKSRKIKEEQINISLTWTGANSFTTATNLISKVGYEFEGIQGEGSGFCSHILNCILQDSIYHVELEDSFPNGLSSTAKGRVTNWTKESRYNGNNDIKDFTLSKTSSKVQLKFFIIKEGDFDLFDMNLINANHRPNK